MKTKLSIALCATLALITLGFQPAWAGNKKFMTINAAKVLAERAIVESVIGLKVRGNEKVEDIIAASVTIEAKTAAEIKGVEYVDIVYDAAKDIAKVTAEIKVGRISNIVGRRINYGDLTIRRVAFATSTPANAAPLQALRAAELDAYKQLAKKIIGFKIKGSSSVENFILKSDDVEAKFMVALYGAELVGYRWDNEGDAYVKLSIRLGLIEDVLGQRLEYNNQVIEVEGTGAQRDDFSEAQQQQPVTEEGGQRQFGTQIREGSLDVPVGGQQPLTGQGLRTDVPVVPLGGGTQLQP